MACGGFTLAVQHNLTILAFNKAGKLFLWGKNIYTQLSNHQSVCQGMTSKGMMLNNYLAAPYLNIYATPVVVRGLETKQVVQVTYSYMII